VLVINGVNDHHGIAGSFARVEIQPKAEMTFFFPLFPSIDELFARRGIMGMS
jgi:hypothetical protein